MNEKDGKKLLGQINEKGITIDYLRDEFERHLPNLAKELSDPNENSALNLNDYREFLEKHEELNPESESDSFLEQNTNNFPDSANKKENFGKIKQNIKSNIKSQYDTNSELFYPKTRDFIRRCETLDEAEEIINYQVKMNEISEDEANELREICRSKGIRVFGSKKEWGYYEKTYRHNSI